MKKSTEFKNFAKYIKLSKNSKISKFCTIYLYQYISLNFLVIFYYLP